MIEKTNSELRFNPKMTNDFCYLLHVRYAECDAQKVVFNARYADYADIAVGEFSKAIWGSYQDLLAIGIDNQVISYSINWSAPARFDDVLAITVKPNKVGNTSYSLHVDFYNYDTQVKIASAEIVNVMVSASDHKKMIIPENMRQQFESGARGVEIDHAGVKART